ncbi:MAG: DUF4838 domain-containing protein [Victivallaceae bacterium]|nr:DUF4838 domain-containing protein [Victivallaceae bacterium]
MNTLLVLILVAVAGMANVTTAAIPGEKQVTRKIKISTKTSITLTENGRINTEIVVPNDATKLARFAAVELQQILTESFGGKVAIVSKSTSGKIAIILGDNKLSRAAGIEIKQLSRDSFIIRTVGKNIYIVGIDDRKVNPMKAMKGSIWSLYYQRATLFGVYDFLERFIGVKFYFPGKIGTIIPEHRTLKIADRIDITDRPDYTIRKFSTYSGKWYEGNLKSRNFPGKNLNYYRLRMETRYIPNNHGMARLGYLERFGKTHPEYFALMKNGRRDNSASRALAGQFCFSSGVTNQIYKDAAAFLSGKTAKEAGILTKRFGYTWDPSGFQPGYFNLMLQDGEYLCRGDKCQAHYSKGLKAKSEFFWQQVVKVAKRLKANGIKGYITAMAYGFNQIVPEVKLPDNVLVMTAVRGPWVESYKNVQQKEDTLVRKWVKKTGRKTWLWNYTNKYGGLNIPDIPALTPRAIGSYYKKMQPDIIGAYMQSNTDRYIFNYLNYYVFSKVAWDNNLDLDALLDEHYREMFGAAAPAMKNIYEKLESLWLNGTFGKPVDTPMGPTCIPPSQYVLWEKIYSTATLKALRGKFDQAEKLAKDDRKALKRVKFMRKNLLKPLLNAAATYHANSNKLDELIFNIKDMPAGIKITVDGKLNDAAWQQSDSILLQRYAGDKGKITVNTVVRGLKDDRNIYIAFDCEEPQLDKMLFSKRQPDDSEIWQDSSVELFLNPSGDKKNYYQLLVNPAGSLTDFRCIRSGSKSKVDSKWNSNAKVKVFRGNKRWTVEIAIPFSEMSGFHSDILPANFNRNRVLEDSKGYVKLYTWSPFLKYGFHDIENFGKVALGTIKETSIINNGNFTAKPRGRQLGKWYAPLPKHIKPGQSWSLDQSTFVKGEQSLKLTNSGTGKKFGITLYLPELKANSKYRLAFYIKTQDLKVNSKLGGAVVNIWDDKNRWFPPRSWYSGTMPWTKQSFEFTTGAKTNLDKNRSYMRLWIINASGTVWFDNVSLKAVK